MLPGMKNLSALTLGSLAVLVVAACSSTESTTPAPAAKDGGVAQDGGTEPAFTHIAYCLTSGPVNPSNDYLKAHRFAVKASRGGTTAAPTITLALSFLKTGKNQAERGDPTIHANNLTTENVVAGAPVNIPNLPLAADGSFVFNSPVDIDIPGAGNPLSGTDVSLGTLVLKGKFEAKPRFFGGFTAKITKAAAGVGAPVTANCIFDAAAMGDQLKAPLKEEYLAPASATDAGTSDAN